MDFPSKTNFYKLYNLSTTHGFLPDFETPKTIRAPYDIYWSICHNLPNLIKDHDIQFVVDHLPIINIDSNTTPEEYKMLYSMLCIIQSAYIWHRGEGCHNKKVPKQIAIPLNFISNHLGNKPLITNASICLYNWQVINPYLPFELNNIKSVFTLTDNKSETHFYHVLIMIEYYGHFILDEIISLIITNPTKQDVFFSLQIISCNLTKFIELLGTMREGCDPIFFNTILRIYLAGWTNEELFPKGMELDGIEKHASYAGGSAAQTSIIHVLDIFFGVQHQNNFLVEMRSYMPKPHRAFLLWLSTSKPGIDFVTDRITAKIYNECLEKLSSFRSYHMGLVHTYIINQSINSGLIIANEGTGGTSNVKLLSILKEFKEETDIAKIR